MLAGLASGVTGEPLCDFPQTPLVARGPGHPLALASHSSLCLHRPRPLPCSSVSLWAVLPVSYDSSSDKNPSIGFSCPLNQDAPS